MLAVSEWDYWLLINISSGNEQPTSNELKGCERANKKNGSSASFRGTWLTGAICRRSHLNRASNCRDNLAVSPSILEISFWIGPLKTKRQQQQKPKSKSNPIPSDA